MAPGGTGTAIDLTGTYAPTATMPNSAIAPGAVIPPMPPGIASGQIPGQVPGQIPRQVPR